MENLDKKLREDTKLVWFESPSNPSLKIIDIEELVKIVRKKNGNKTLILIDSTFASPYL